MREDLFGKIHTKKEPHMYRGKSIYILAISLLAVLLFAANSYGYGSFGSDVDDFCSVTQPYGGIPDVSSGQGCSLCHYSNRGSSHPGKTAYNNGNLCYFCADNDNDSFKVEGNSCGAIDCDDSNETINPGMEDIANDGIDQDCSGEDKKDSDNDGIADLVETGGTDTDNDGLNDGYEISEGFDPLDSADCPGWICSNSSRRGWRLGIGL